MSVYTHTKWIFHKIVKRVRTNQLIRHISMIFARHSFTNGGLHQSRQRGEHIDRGIDLSKGGKKTLS